MALRKQEFKRLVGIKLIDAFLCVFWNSFSVILLVATIIGYVKIYDDLGSLNIYTIIALTGYITDPSGILAACLGSLSVCLVSFRRMSDFLN